MVVQTADFHYHLPPELIAQLPAPRRDQSRLLVLHRAENRIEHRRFQDFPEHLGAGDVLVLNNSRVIPARLHGQNSKTGGQFEILLIEENGINDWWAMMRPGKRAKIGAKIVVRSPKSEAGAVVATVAEINVQGHRRLQFSGTANIFNDLDGLGEIPLPPYIVRHVKNA